ncbi:hypothetical protein N0V85_004122 [Neurospora sp. IMI 360204]|nr:hypothetical protein N0V85_004122 [Neurospora sp. IMI 360204]
MHVLPKLHAKYGPILRISPTEVHLSDPSNYSEIYSSSSSSYKYPKDPDFYNAMEGPIRAPVLLTVKSSDEHRVRRAALNPFFSRRSVLELVEQQIIKTKTEKLCGMIFQTLFPPFKNIKWIESLETVRVAVTKVREEIETGIKPDRRTIFHELIDLQPLTDENVKGRKSSAKRAIFDSPEIYGKLRKELRDAFPDVESINLGALEKLPYLTGVIKEALRLKPGLPGHLPRLVPSPGATFNSVPLPPGISISMSAWLMHYDPVAFGTGKEQPTVFDPERWIPHTREDEERIRIQERCMVPFGKGSRNCLGQALAMAELYSTLGNMFWRFDDLVVEELFLGYHPRGARKLRILRGREDR